MDKKQPPGGLFLCYRRSLFDSYFSAADSFASKTANLANLVGNNAIAVSVYGEVAAELGAFTRALGHANLTNNNLASADFFTTKQLNTEALALAVASVFGCTACFNV
jgi:hypothetical protein